MAQPLTLLTLPAELRQQIWQLTFAHRNVYPAHSSFDIASSECAGCQTQESQSLSIDITSYKTAFAPLLVNKQINTEASSLFYETLKFYMSSYHALRDIRISSNPKIRSKVHNLTLYTHLTSETRYHWLPELGSLVTTFPSLGKLRIHNHMRAPTSYDRLIDGIYLLGPLITLPSYIRPSATRPLAPSTPSSATVDENSTANTNQQEQDQVRGHRHDSNADQPQTQQPQVDSKTKTSHAEASTEEPILSTSRPPSNFSISFAYTNNDTLFESPFIGTVTTADAIDEHEAVLRDCIADQEFRAMATAQDLNGMTVVMLGIARAHEQTWLDDLHVRRLGEALMQTEILGEIRLDSDGDNDGDGIASNDSSDDEHYSEDTLFPVHVSHDTGLDLGGGRGGGSSSGGHIAERG